MHSCKSTLRLMLGKLLVRHQMKVHLSHFMVVLRLSAVAASNLGFKLRLCFLASPHLQRDPSYVLFVGGKLTFCCILLFLSCV